MGILYKYNRETTSMLVQHKTLDGANLHDATCKTEGGSSVRRLRIIAGEEASPSSQRDRFTFTASRQAGGTVIYTAARLRGLTKY